VSSVRYEYAGGLARITLTAAPQGNPISPEMAAELFGAVRRARADDARVILLRSEGRFFSVGGDVAAFASAIDREQMVDDLAETLHRIISDLHRMNAIVVSAVQGTAAGAGTALAAAADVVVAGKSALFTSAYTKLGFSPDGGTSLLTASLGLHRALHFALLNTVLSAEQAQAAGLVAEVVADEDLEAASEQLAQNLLAGSRTAQVAAKRLLRQVAQPGAEAALRLETIAIRTCASSPDGMEGVDAFLAKREARFPTTLSGQAGADG
jgi:2-(1,2-epoxy-1,2-dihydrophenyl)acetyl-CoA isomerase